LKRRKEHLHRCSWLFAKGSSDGFCSVAAEVLEGKITQLWHPAQAVPSLCTSCSGGVDRRGHVASKRDAFLGCSRLSLSLKKLLFSVACF